MTHFIKLCAECGRIIAQCRCCTPGKEVIYGVCKNCLTTAEEYLGDLTGSCKEIAVEDGS